MKEELEQKLAELKAMKDKPFQYLVREAKILYELEKNVLENGHPDLEVLKLMRREKIDELKILEKMVDEKEMEEKTWKKKQSEQ